MKHLSDEELISWHYGESGPDGENADVLHLEQCRECNARYASLMDVLDAVDALPVPERGTEYAARIWKNIARDVPVAGRGRWALAAPWNWVAPTAAAASLLVAGFLAGRHSVPASPAEALVASPMAANVDIGTRVLLLAVADHLERSQMMLVELTNSEPKFDRDGRLNIVPEQQRAEELVSENRLYRQTAQFTGQTAVAGVLEELERVLLNIAHSPSEISAQELEDLRQRFESEGILFKLRVLRSNVRVQQPATIGKL